MAGRSGRRHVDPGSPLVDLDAVFADDALVDAIAGQAWGGDPVRLSKGPAARTAAGSHHGGLLTADPLTELFEAWRSELAMTPMPAPPSAIRTSAPVQQRPPSRKRTLRPALAIAAAIAALLVGAASIGSKDAPRDSPLFALTTVLWPSRAVSVASADQVDAILVAARDAIKDGRTQDAQLALLQATVVLGSVDVLDGKDDRQQAVAAMWVEVAPQSPSGAQPRESVGSSGPTSPGTKSDNAWMLSTPSAVLAAQTAAGTTAAGQPAEVQVAAPQPAGPLIVPPPAATSALQVALGAGWPSSQAEPPPVVGEPVLTDTAAAVPSGAPVVSVVESPPVVEATSAAPSVPPTPPAPTAPVDPPAEIPTSDPPSATEQSPPAPTPSEPGQTVDTSTPDSAGPFSSETDASAEVDPNATGSG